MQGLGQFIPCPNLWSQRQFDDRGKALQAGEDRILCFSLIPAQVKGEPLKGNFLVGKEISGSQPFPGFLGIELQPFIIY